MADDDLEPHFLPAVIHDDDVDEPHLIEEVDPDEIDLSAEQKLVKRVKHGGRPFRSYRKSKRKRGHRAR